MTLTLRGKIDKRLMKQEIWRVMLRYNESDSSETLDEEEGFRAELKQLPL